MTPAVPHLAWTDDGVPYAPAFDDTYFARGDGLGETRQVFLAGNGLPERWRDADDFTIAELGFGTSLNFVETWRQWRESVPPEGRLTYVGFERFPLDADQMRRVLQRWPELAALAAPLLRRWPPGGADTTWQLDARLRLRLILGDANATLPTWPGQADAWYLDGFAPARNPEMWTAALLQAVYDHTRPGGGFATYTAAGWVRRNLRAAGFAVRKVPGFAGKRHMLRGTRPSGA